MAFFERKFDENKDFPEYRALLGVSGKVPLLTPQGWVVDERRGINFFELGGRGEMPASTGAPPNVYILIVGSLVYSIAMRRNVTDGKSGGVVYIFSIESIDFPAENRLSQEEIILLLREVIVECEKSRLHRVDPQSFVEDVVIRV